MAVHLDHLIVHSRNKTAAAKLIAELLGVAWGESAVGPFAAVYVNDGLTLDFDQSDDPFPIGHYAFRVVEPEFGAILERIKAAGIPYRSSPHGPADSRVGSYGGGNMVYWSEPDGHAWEILTVSYARRPSGAQSAA